MSERDPGPAPGPDPPPGPDPRPGPEQAEKTRLQRAVTDLKAGKMDAVYEQARQDAEKAVLDRMMASGFSFEQGR